MSTLIIFIILTIINVIFSTIKSIVTIKNGKTIASIISAAYYAFYIVVIMYTVADFPMYQKIAVTFFCNLVGVYVVKLGEEKTRKDKLWKIELTVNKGADTDWLIDRLKVDDISFNYIENIGKYTLFNIYCATKEESSIVKHNIKAINAKYFVNESETL